MVGSTASQTACHADIVVYHMLPNHCSPTCANAWELPDEAAWAWAAGMQEHDISEEECQCLTEGAMQG